MAFAKATRLPDLLLSQCGKLEEEKRKLRLDRAHRDKQFWLYYQVGANVQINGPDSDKDWHGAFCLFFLLVLM